MKRTVTLTREIEFEVEVEGHSGDDGQGFEYSVEDGPVIAVQDLGGHLDVWSGHVVLELTNGEVDRAIEMAREQ